jgi:hypothetical protein
MATLRCFDEVVAPDPFRALIYRRPSAQSTAKLRQETVILQVVRSGIVLPVFTCFRSSQTAKKDRLSAQTAARHSRMAVEAVLLGRQRSSFRCMPRKTIKAT